MKKRMLLVSLFALFILVFCCGSAELKKVVTEDGRTLKLWREASAGSELLGRIMDGAVVNVIDGGTEGGMIRVSYLGAEGYVESAALAVPDLHDLYSVREDDEHVLTVTGTQTDFYFLKSNPDLQTYMSVSRMEDIPVNLAAAALAAIEAGSIIDTADILGRNCSLVDAPDRAGAQVDYICIPMDDGDTLVIEGHFMKKELDEAARVFNNMLEGLQLHERTFAAGVPVCIRCSECGQWMLSTDYLRHLCLAWDSQDYEQCQLCGQWFHAGSELTGHACPARVPETFYQCPDCDQWLATYQQEKEHSCPALTDLNDDSALSEITKRVILIEEDCEVLLRLLEESETSDSTDAEKE